MTKKRYSIQLFLTGFIGYIMGTTGYSLIGGENRVLYYLSGFVVASVIGLLYYFYLREKHGKVLKEIEIERKDERGQVIVGITSSYTLILATVLSLSRYVFSLVKGYEVISIMIAISYIITVLFNVVLHFYLEKVN